MDQKSENLFHELDRLPTLDFWVFEKCSSKPKFSSIYNFNQFYFEKISYFNLSDIVSNQEPQAGQKKKNHFQAKRTDYRNKFHVSLGCGWLLPRFPVLSYIPLLLAWTPHHSGMCHWLMVFRAR